MNQWKRKSAWTGQCHLKMQGLTTNWCVLTNNHLNPELPGSTVYTVRICAWVWVIARISVCMEEDADLDNWSHQRIAQHFVDCKTVVFGRFWKAQRVVASLPILLRPFYTHSRPFVRILPVTRIRKTFDCFAVWTFWHWLLQLLCIVIFVLQDILFVIFSLISHCVKLNFNYFSFVGLLPQQWLSKVTLIQLVFTAAM